MFDFFKSNRNSRGDLTLPFFGFILVGALTIASLTGLSQYNILKSKLDNALFIGQTKAQNYISDNLSDSSVITPIQDQVAVDAVLAAARSEGISAAAESLSNLEAKLVALNGGTAISGIFDQAGTIVELNSDGTVSIQFSVSSNMISNIPIQYSKATSLLRARPSAISASVNPIDLDCPGDGTCGECGGCDRNTGNCIPLFEISDGQGGFKSPDTENATADAIACLDENPCAAIGEGWNLIEEAGRQGCEKDNCKYIPNYHSIQRSPAFGFSPSGYGYTLFDIGVYNRFFADSLGYEGVCQSGTWYDRGPETTASELSDNFYDGEATYAVCASPYEHDTSAQYTMFVTSTRVRPDIGVGGMDNVCNQSASNALLQPPGAQAFKAMLERYSGFRNTFRSDQKYYNTRGELLNGCPLYSRSNTLGGSEFGLNRPPNIDEYGNQIPASVQAIPSGCSFFCFPTIVANDDRVWTGVSSDGTNDGIGRHCNYWTALDGNMISSIGNANSSGNWLGGDIGFVYGGYRCNGFGNYPFQFGSSDGNGFRLYCVGPR